MAVYDYTPLYGAGDIIPGTTAGILARLGIENPNVPVFQLLGSENKGQPMNAAERMQFAAQPGQSYRLVNKATGEVLGTASTPEGISALVEQSNTLSQKLGNKANLSFEQSIPEALGGGFTPIFRDEPNKVAGGLLGTVMDVGIPTLAALAIPGAGLLGTILPAAGGSAASSLAQGRGLEETLLRAAISGAGAGLGEKFLAPALDKAFSPAVSAATQAGTQAGTQAATQAGTQALAGGAGDIVVNALPSLVSRGLTTGLTSLASNLLPNAFDSSQFAQPTQVQQPAQTEYTAPPENIILTAPEQVAPSLVPAVAGGVSNALLDQVASPTAPSDEIVVTAKDAEPVNFGGLAPVLLPSVGAALASSIGATATPPLTEGTTSKGFLGTGLSASELLALGGVGVAGLQSLFGGAGGTGTTAVPYVSPFGAGAGVGGLGGGRDYRITPSITDYERYGFGPEAAFFAPEYSQLVSGAATTPAATTVGPQASTINPKYVPLI